MPLNCVVVHNTLIHFVHPSVEYISKIVVYLGW